jgi:hypothetical protein
MFVPPVEPLGDVKEGAAELLPPPPVPPPALIEPKVVVPPCRPSDQALWLKAYPPEPPEPIEAAKVDA